mmetsp:Transcript_9513/g.30411  ORF Transcript_9513/g.30411 Transcript_9513/m.30411 type:complete len:918 (+) Transcript_9513:48-2801(+)
MMVRCWAAVSLVVGVCVGAPLVTVTERPSLVYSTVSPKLRLQGTGFRGDGSSLRLKFVPTIPEETYKIQVVSETVLSLNLVPGKSWPVGQGESGTTVYLTELRDEKLGGGENLLDDSIAVATVIETPQVMHGGDKVIYMSGTPKFNINGTGFRAKSTDLAFDPPLEKDVDYVLWVRSPTFMQLTLKTGRKWRSDGDPGPLKLKRINTGAGELRIDARFGGVTVAEVQVDLGAHGVTVETTPETRVYQSTPQLRIIGAGFNATPAANTLKWGNSLRGKGVNYTIAAASSSSLTLTLGEGSTWRANPGNLPGPLTLLAVNAGAGLVPVGPTELKKGRVVATVYENPGVDANPTKTVFQSHTHELWITGTGFVRSSTKLTFDPPLAFGQEYIMAVFNRTHLLVSLMDGSSWAPTPGILRVVAVDTGAGNVRDFKPVPVAHVSADQDDHASGISVTRTATQTLYQTLSSRSLLVTGSGFCEDPVVAFDPPLVLDTDYTIASHQLDQLELALVGGRKWHPRGGPLKAKSVSCPGVGVVDLAYGDGIVVATILPDPLVDAAERRIYTTHTKRLVISGSGFSMDSTHVTLDPTPPGAYEIASVEQTEVVLTLKDGKSWLPLGAGGAGNGEDAIAAIFVEKIDTGAGDVVMAGERGVEIAQVFADPEGAVCDDSCEWSLDGVCDDGTYENNVMRAWEDDDMGGFYAYDDDYYGGFGYYYEDDEAAVFSPVCSPGTDCTDCGADRGPDEYASALATVECDNSCQWANDGYCDDTRTSGLCRLGTDCKDCGPASAGNFTEWNDDAWWDDDGSYWDDDYAVAFDAVDDELGANAKVLYIKSIPNPRTKAKDLNDQIGVGGLFMLVLEGIVVSIGLVMCSIASFFAYRYYKGQHIPIQLAPTPSDLDPNDKQRAPVPITPDVTYSNSKV